MKGFNAKACMIIAGTMAFNCVLMVGCSPKPSTKGIAKLQDQQSSTESAEKKLAEARQERIRLEQELQAKKVQLQESKQELKAQSAQPAAEQKIEAPQAPTAGQVAPAAVPEQAKQVPDTLLNKAK